MKLALISSLFLSFFFSSQAFSQIGAGEAQALKPEAMRGWENRADPEALAQGLSKMDMMAEATPEDIDLLTLLARGYFLMGEFHTESKNIKMKMFEKAKNYALQGLETNPEYKKHKEKDIEKAIGALTEREAPLAFWAAACLGKWSKLNGVMASLKYKDQMLGMIKKVGELKPDYFYAGVPRFWGGFYAVAPGIAGGDIKKSKKKFEEALAKAPEYLGNKVLYAETYLVEEEKEKEFKQVLEEVIAAPAGPQEIAPENALEKQKAQRLLKEIKDLF